MEERRGDRLGGSQDWAEEEKAFQEGGTAQAKAEGVQVGQGRIWGLREQQEIKLQAINQAVKPSRHILPNLLSPSSLDSFVHPSIS